MNGSMRRSAAALTLMLIPSLALAQHKPWEEYHKKIATSRDVQQLTNEAFGDAVDLYNGRLMFSHTDVDIPGNNKLAVKVTRRFSAEAGAHGMLFGDWAFDVPHLGGTYAKDMNWITHPSYNWPGQRCSGARVPPLVEAAFWPMEYWHGISTNIPGGGELLEPIAGVSRPTSGGPYLWVTNGNTWFSCLSTIENGTGEGFLAVTPDGTKYWFNWLSTSPDEIIEKYMPHGMNPDQTVALQLSRNRVILHATRVEDRHGNWVTYTYSNASNAKPKLDSIQSSDGRSISISYNPAGNVSSISSAGKTWVYSYTTAGSLNWLTGVQLPDSTTWEINITALRPSYPMIAEGTTCSNPGFFTGPAVPEVGTIKHPAGATAEFQVEPRLHGRTNVPKNCLPTGESLIGIPESGTYSDFVRMYWATSLTKKTITGPGLDIAQWLYNYPSSLRVEDLPVAGQGPGSWSSTPYTGNDAPSCVVDACAGVTATEVAGPGEWTRYTYGNSYRYNEKKLLRVDRGSGPQQILRTEVTEYQYPASGQPYPARLGVSIQYKGDSFSETLQRPARSSRVTQQGVVFSETIDQFDSYARPVVVTKSSYPTP